MARILSLLTVALLAFVPFAAADDKKETKKDAEVKLEGTVQCAKCSLKVAKACHTVIVVKGKDKEKDTTYYFDKDSNKKYHGDTCTETKDGTVTGTVSKDGDRTVINVKSLEYKK